MSKHHNILKFCLTLALVMAGFSGTHAALIIDTFDEGSHSAPPQSEIATASAIGGFRLLDQVVGENIIRVITGQGLGFLDNIAREVGGQTKVEWNGGGGGLGGIDLTAGGDRFQLSSLNFSGDFVAFTETLTLRVTDTTGGQSRFQSTYQDLCDTALSCASYEIPFSSLNPDGGGPVADLTSVDVIALEFATTPANQVDLTIGSFKVVPVPANDDVVVDLGSVALWAWMNDASWLKLNNGSPDRVTTGDMDGNGEDDVIADFASTLGGIFVKYNLGGWTQLANVAAEQMTSGDLDNNGQDDVVIDAGASLGLWARMNNSSWLKLNNASPEQVVVGDMDNNGADDVIADFGVDGIFVKRNLGAWVKLHNNDPEDMTIGNLDNAAGDDLVVDFGAGLALWARMNDSSWLKLNNGSPDVMATGDIDGNGADDVLAGFATTVGGFWQKLNLGGWTQLNPNSPDDVVSADVTGNGQDDIVGDFGSTIGGLFIKRDQGAWVKQHNTSPDSMAPGELD